MINVKHTGGSQYIINGNVITASSWKEATALYLATFCGGSKPIFS